MDELKKDIQKILHNRRIHWSIQMEAFLHYKEVNPTLNLNQISYHLNIGLDAAMNFGTLEYYCKRYPNLQKIQLKSEAIKIIKNYSYDEKLLREKIKIAGLLNKTKLQQKEITKYVKYKVTTENTAKGSRTKKSKVRAETGDDQISFESD